MPSFDSTRKLHNDLLAQRADHLNAAEAALSAGNMTDYNGFMDKVKALNPQIEDAKRIIDEADRYAAARAPKFGTDKRDMAEMGRALAAGERVKIDLANFGRMDMTTLATGTLTTPQGTGMDVRSGFTSQVSSLIDQVQTVDLTGLSSYEEPYVVAEMAAQAGTIAATAGQARTPSDPTFAKARIAPYETTVTTYVDRNLSRLNPANYAEKIQMMALRALRRKANSLIVNGDGTASPNMFGITNAKNTAGNAIYATIAQMTAIGVNTMDDMVFAYGGSEEVGGNARLLLSKANLKAFGQLRGTNEKKRLYNIVPDAANPNTGVIEDGGLIVPYTIVSDLGDSTIAYGDPYNYELGLFGDFTIRLDESYKAAERLVTILGDAMIGGNLVVDKGFVIGTIGE